VKQSSKGSQGALKEAFINVETIFKSSTLGKELHEEMVREAQNFQNYLKKKGEEIELAKKELAKKAAAMSADAARTEEKKIAQLEREFAALAKEKEEDFQVLAAQKEQAWAQEFQQIVADWAQELQFQVVWDELSGRPLYVDNNLKHTDDVTVRMNKKNSERKSIPSEKSKDASVKKV
jgi:Skp family chaperone for outer membrane proteins